MDWVVDNWKIISLVASAVANVLVAMKYKTAAKWLRIVVEGVEDGMEATRSKAVAKAIKARATEAGVEEKLKPYVMKVRAGWTSPLREQKE